MSMTHLSDYHAAENQGNAANLSCRGRRRRALTRAELGLTLGMLLLMVTLLPAAMRATRARVMAATCATILQRFGIGLQMYALDNDDYIPGVNTSGVAVSVKLFSWHADPNELNESNLPVQTYDWMTPLAMYDAEVTPLPEIRAERWYALWTNYRCPQNPWMSVPYITGSLPDRNALIHQNPWPACSYLMPAYFGLWGDDYAGEELATMEWIPQSVTPKRALDNWNVSSPSDYRSRLDQVGPAGRKVFIADGTRFVVDPGGFIDHDCDPFSAVFGAFTAMGAWWAGTTAYGVAEGSCNWDGTLITYGSPSDGWNLQYSYRHILKTIPGPKPPLTAVHGATPGSDEPPSTAQDNSGGIRTLMFDGHVELLTDRQSREIELWYPSGSVLENASNGMLDYPNGYIVP